MGQYNEKERIQVCRHLNLIPISFEVLRVKMPKHKKLACNKIKIKVKHKVALTIAMPNEAFRIKFEWSE